MNDGQQENASEKTVHEGTLIERVKLLETLMDYRSRQIQKIGDQAELAENDVRHLSRRLKELEDRCRQATL
jgi:hypothetical protein